MNIPQALSSLKESPFKIDVNTEIVNINGMPLRFDKESGGQDYWTIVDKEISFSVEAHARPTDIWRKAKSALYSVL